MMIVEINTVEKTIVIEEATAKELIELLGKYKDFKVISKDNYISSPYIPYQPYAPYTPFYRDAVFDTCNTNHTASNTDCSHTLTSN